MDCNLATMASRGSVPLNIEASNRAPRDQMIWEVNNALRSLVQEQVDLEPDNDGWKRQLEAVEEELAPPVASQSSPLTLSAFDHRAYPHVFELILRHLPFKIALKWRMLSRDVRSRIDTMAGHMELSTGYAGMAQAVFARPRYWLGAAAVGNFMSSFLSVHDSYGSFGIALMDTLCRARVLDIMGPANNYLVNNVCEKATAAVVRLRAGCFRGGPEGDFLLEWLPADAFVFFPWGSSDTATSTHITFPPRRMRLVYPFQLVQLAGGVKPVYHTTIPFLDPAAAHDVVFIMPDFTLLEGYCPVWRTDSTWKHLLHMVKLHMRNSKCTIIVVNFSGICPLWLSDCDEAGMSVMQETFMSELFAERATLANIQRQLDGIQFYSRNEYIERFDANWGLETQV